MSRRPIVPRGGAGAAGQRNSPGQRLRDRIHRREQAKANRTSGGIKGKNTYAILHQGEIWHDFEGDEHEIVAMSIRYKRNLLRWLERNATHLQLLAYWSIPYHVSNGEMAQLQLDMEYELECERILNAEPVDWIRRTPLYEAVQMSVARGEDGTDGEDPGKLERYKVLLDRRRDDNLAMAEDRTWD